MHEASYPLVLVEWVDSVQPHASWCYIEDFLQNADLCATVHCRSVGWLIRDDEKVKILAPNLGDPAESRTIQGSGMMRIPANAVIRIVKLHQPKVAKRR